MAGMRDLLILFVHLIVTLARLAKPDYVLLSPNRCWSGINCWS